jgi:hypothetical protein
MKAVIFYAPESVYKREWATFIRQAGDLNVPQTARRLAPNVWFFTLPEGETFRRELAALAKQRGLLSHSLEVACEGQWREES